MIRTGCSAQSGSTLRRTSSQYSSQPSVWSMSNRQLALTEQIEREHLAPGLDALEQCAQLGTAQLALANLVDRQPRRAQRLVIGDRLRRRVVDRRAREQHAYARTGVGRSVLDAQDAVDAHRYAGL